MAKRGPKANYQPEHCEIARQFCLLGATNEDLAEHFEVSISTIGNWTRTYPEFKVALHEGRDTADAEIAEKLYRRAKGLGLPAVKLTHVDGEIVETPCTRQYPPDTQAAMFWLRNRRRQRWRERIEREHTPNDELMAILDAASECARQAIKVRVELQTAP